MWVAQLISIFALLCLGADALAVEVQPGFFPIHSSEPRLLHHHITPSLFLGLKVWDTRLATWRAMQPPEVPGERSPLLILHLWADWCVPCREEFPIIRGLMDELGKTYGDQVQMILLSETPSPEAMRAFLEKHGTRIPRGPHYLDTGEAIAAKLRSDLPTPLSYPLTLVLDSQRIVRHAIVGTVTARRVELLSAITLLLAAPRSSAPASIR